MAFDSIAFGERIQKARRKRGLTQVKLAEMAELGPAGASWLWRIENGQRVPKVDTFAKIVAALKIPPDELMWE